MGPLQTVGDYTMQVIRKMQKDHIKSWVPRQDITDRFNEHAQVRAPSRMSEEIAC